MPLTIGLPRMHKEAGELRDFLPELAASLDPLDVAEIVLEEGCGSGMDIPPAAYLEASKKVRFASNEQAWAQDLVLVLRFPEHRSLELMKKGATLLSMIHYPTRPGRVRRLPAQGLEAVSLDSIVDDKGRRLLENLESVGWNGLRTAFEVIRRRDPAFASPDRKPYRVTVLGVGAVGGNAVQAASRYGNPKLRAELAAEQAPGVIVTAVDYDLTGHEAHMRELLASTDVLVDATQRPDPSRPVIPNRWLAELPEEAVLVDLSVDPYDLDADPVAVKGLEGCPQGDLDQFVFPPDDPAFDRIDKRVDTTHRRTAVSCYSWPGVYPKPCMEVYGRQLAPLLKALIGKGGVAGLDLESADRYERAVARAELGRWKKLHGQAR